MRLSILAIIASCLLSVVSARAEDPFAIGKEAFAKGDYLTAVAKFRDAVDKEKKNPLAYLWLGKALFMIDSLNLSEAALVRGRELDTANAEIYSLLGDVYGKQRIYKAAMDKYKTAATFDPNNISLFLKLLDVSKKARQYNDAVEAGTRALALDSNNIAALTETGSIYLRAKKYANAVPIYERLNRLQPNTVPVLLNLAKALIETKSFEKFIPVGEATLKLDAGQTEVQTWLAEAYNATHQIDKVVEQYAKLNVDSLGVDDLLRYAKALKMVEKFENSLAVFQKAYKKDSTRCDIPYEYGTTLMKVKRYPEAVQMFDRKLACDTSAGYQFASHLNAAMSEMQMKQFKQASEHILKAIEKRPDNITAWKTLAQDYVQMEMSEEEVSAYKKMIELALAAGENGDPNKYNADLEEAYRMIGVRYLLDKKYALALEYLKKALPFKPNDCQMLLWAGQAAQNSNNKEEARKFYCKLIKTCPKSKEADNARSFLDILGMKCED
jgi:tetratricopeptide (TPR) repeat protein